MSEHQAALAHTATAPAAVAARPRISADAFRNLTARLKKADVQIPTLSPVAPPAQAEVVQPVVQAAPVIAAEAVAPAVPVFIEPIVVEPVAVVAELPVAPIVEVAPPAALTEFEAILPEAFESLSPLQDAGHDIHVESHAEAEAVLAAAHSTDSAAEYESLPVQAMEALELPTAELEEPTVFAVDLDMLPSAVDVQDVLPEPTASVAAPIILPVAVDFGIEPVAEVSVIEPATVEPVHIESAFAEAAPVAVKIYPDLPEFVPTPVQAVEPPAPAPEPALQGSFAENFTYVPEKGKEEDAPKLDLTDVSEAIKQEVAQRATELELENNWRLLLAKPTAEDRSTYLREAAEYHAADDEWNKPAPEHDLSQIAPADDAVPGVETEYVPPVPAAMERSLVDTLPTATGQDLSEVARSLLDMMAAGNASGLPQERALAADTLLRLVPRLELKPVVLLAQRLAMMDNPPNLLVARLIRDQRVEVAGPLLEDCTQISDKDLESVVQEGEPDKLRMIARRRKLSRAISDALIKSGDASVVLTLVRNAEAEISHDGFASLLVLCENHQELLAPLATRQDLSAPYAFEMFWLAPAQLRRFILSRFLTDSETLTKILKITMATNTMDEVEAEPLSQHAMLEALERAARGHTEVASEELANLMQVGTTTVQRILSDLAGEPLVIMLKAAGYPRSAVPGLMKRMQDADLPVISRERDITELQNMFETLSFNKARILLTYWDWAQKKLGPYAPVQ